MEKETTQCDFTFQLVAVCAQKAKPANEGKSKRKGSSKGRNAAAAERDDRSVDEIIIDLRSQSEQNTGAYPSFYDSMMDMENEDDAAILQIEAEFADRNSILKSLVAVVRGGHGHHNGYKAELEADMDMQM